MTTTMIIKVVYLSLSSVQHCHQCPLQIEPLLNPDALIISGGIAHSNSLDISDSMKKIISSISNFFLIFKLN